ncbi:MAG: hypothetical protein IT435_03500 [Phycisphaerales bacterium]|nr:hypothetical protein [Phycisphaerales bacterium]
MAKIIQDALKHSDRVIGPRTRVQAEEIRLENDEWWYVPVAYYIGDGKDWAYFEMFSNVEDKLQDEGLNVLLVPRRLTAIEPD